MTKKDLVKIIREVVRREVQKEVKKIFIEEQTIVVYDFGGGTFDSSRMAELMGYGKPEEVKRDMVAVDTFKKAGVSSEQVPDHITKALTRDYSDLMKHDKMKGK